MLTFDIGYKHPKQQFQFLIILPPINSIFLFLFSLTWIERRFRLSYIPFICIFILLLSSLSLTIISSLFLSFSIILYFNLIFYSLCTIIFFLLLLLLIISYLYGSFTTHHQNQSTNQLIKTSNSSQLNKIIFESNEHQLILFMSHFPADRQSHDFQTMIDELNQVHIDTILSLNEKQELSFMNINQNTNFCHMDVYSTRIKRANIEHIIYPIRKSFIPKSISDYMQFLYSIINNINRNDRRRLLVHCMNGFGRTGMTIVCFELLYEYIMNENEREKRQKFFERFCHYPLLLENSCRVCHAISNIRKIRPKSIHNPIQIIFVHEFYAP
ncbi:hypothetical protein I4U23_007585 [Adineta vaga]|nr:hypothetical protein I4U23_007585 [Adineta vaga]